MQSVADHPGAKEAGAGGRLTIDLSALRSNWRTLAERCAPARAAGVVKANGYGLGMETVVPALYAEGCRDFFVALAAEGVEARRFAPDARIFVLNGYFAGSAALHAAADLIPIAGSLQDIAAWQADCAPQTRPFALQVDTGMNRIGLTPREAIAYAAAMRAGGAARPVLVMSHLACADTATHELNRLQLESFQEVRAAFGSIESSLANSGGIFLGAGYHFDLVRPGIALYGGEAVEGASAMRPVATLEARICAVREVPAGVTVGYGATQVLERDTRIATCSVGYADGYPRSASGTGVPLRQAVAEGACGFVAGRRVPLVGRVTMDLTMFDVTDCEPGSVVQGGFIELFGTSMPLDDVARAAGTIGYELLTGLSGRYQRRIVNG